MRRHNLRGVGGDRNVTCGITKCQKKKLDNPSKGKDRQKRSCARSLVEIRLTAVISRSQFPSIGFGSLAYSTSGSLIRLNSRKLIGLHQVSKRNDQTKLELSQVLHSIFKSNSEECPACYFDIYKSISLGSEGLLLHYTQG